MKRIVFKNETAPFNVVSENEKFMVCTRKLCKVDDKEYLEHAVSMDAFLNFESAYKFCKDYVMYTICDIEKNIRGVHDLKLNIYDFNDKEECDIVLKDLTDGKLNVNEDTCISEISYKLL